MSKLLIPGILQQQANAQQGGGGEIWILDFNDISGTGAGNTNEETIPESVILHATVTGAAYETSIRWYKNSTATICYSYSSYNNRTMIFNQNDSLYFNVRSDYGDSGSITLRETDTNGRIISEFNYSISGFCFLTTACVSYMGLKDNGPELNAMRKLRNEYMNIYYPEEIIAYYKNAPKILKAIPEIEHNDVMTEIFTTVKKVQEILVNNDFKVARIIYLDLYYRLKNRYL